MEKYKTQNEKYEFLGSNHPSQTYLVSQVMQLFPVQQVGYVRSWYPTEMLFKIQRSNWMIF